MDTLRVSLLIIGALLIGLIYYIGRRQLDAEDRSFRIPSGSTFLSFIQKLRRRYAQRFAVAPVTEPVADKTRSPHISIDELDDIEPIVADRHDALGEHDELTDIVELTSEQIAPAGEQLFIPVTILGKHGRRIDGESIVRATRDCGFKLDESGIYYHEVEDAQGYAQKLLGLANILEPGTFSHELLSEEFSTPGLVLYLHLPAPVEARDALSLLIERARNLAQFLDADLCDETRSVLTNQTIGHLKEKVEAFRFKQKMTQLKHHRS